MKTIAIMQPTYLPWIGYFAMIDRVDEFVFLDSVQFEHRSWQHRNKIKSSVGVQLLTVPVQIKGNRSARIADMKILKDEEFQRKHLASIEHSYNKTDFYSDYAEEFKRLMNLHCGGTIADLTIALTMFLANALGIRTPMLRASTMNTAGRRAELLSNICKERGADRYLSAPGSRDYLEMSDDFERNKISVRFHEYAHPVYRQLYGEFTPYLSIVDLLFNCGSDSLAILKAGVRPCE